jgi:hypothetical protein
MGRSVRTLKRGIFKGADDGPMTRSQTDIAFAGARAEGPGPLEAGPPSPEPSERGQGQSFGEAFPNLMTNARSPFFYRPSDALTSSNADARLWRGT